MNRGRHRKPKQHVIIQILGSTISNRIMECQKEQGNSPNLDVFLKRWDACRNTGGFSWGLTTEDYRYWNDVMERMTNHPLYIKTKYERS